MATGGSLMKGFLSTWKIFIPVLLVSFLYKKSSSLTVSFTSWHFKSLSVKLGNILLVCILINSEHTAFFCAEWFLKIEVKGDKR